MGKGGRSVTLTTLHHHVPLSRNLGNVTSWNPLGPSGSVMGLLYLFLPSITEKNSNILQVHCIGREIS